MKAEARPTRALAARLDLSGAVIGAVIGLTLTTKICSLIPNPPEPELAALPLTMLPLFHHSTGLTGAAMGFDDLRRRWPPRLTRWPLRRSPSSVSCSAGACSCLSSQRLRGEVAVGAGSVDSGPRCGAGSRAFFQAER